MGLGQIIKQAIQKVIDSPMKPIYKYPLAGLMLVGLGAAAYFGVA
ncbi:hypothetical protein [Aeromonas rivipollensis]|nr:hypothetical protein [Aeromonas rivipollensis]